MTLFIFHPRLCLLPVNPDMALMLNGVEYELDSRGMRPRVDVTGDVKVTVLGVGYGAYTSTLLLDAVAAWYGSPAPRRGSYCDVFFVLALVPHETSALLLVVH